MPNPRLAARYAKSLVDLSIERGQLENIIKDMQWLQLLCRESREFVNVLRSPIINLEKKDRIIDAVIKNNVSELTMIFAHLLVKKGRESHLPEIISSFIDQYKEYKHIYTVKLTTAAPLSEELKSAIVKQIQTVSEMKNIELETAVKPELIGGFVLQAGDKLVDASISYDLKEIARQFESNDFVYKIR
ncbi:MAG: ATP synthase F1 subunit delta [Sphingobacteriales bacterium UTBCD1]|jgi:F-type H+-transporting ATPase subunit delta|nr:MAG: ATP synthase F1 subunit delta [Sphingobacteriales bacterium UTBCD1]